MRARNFGAVVIGAVLIATAGLVTSAAFADGPGGHGPAGRREMGGGFGLLGAPLWRLDLTQEQKDQVKAIIDEAKPGIQALRQQLHDMRQTFATAHPPTEFDEAAIRAEVASEAPVLANIEVAIAQARSKALALLTPDQLTQLKDMKTAMHERGQGPMQRHGW